MTARYYYFPDGDRFDHIILAEAKDYEELEAKCEHTTRMLESLYVDHKALVEKLESLQRANAGLEAALQWADRRHRSLLKKPLARQDCDEPALSTDWNGRKYLDISAHGRTKLWNRLNDTQKTVVTFLENIGWTLHRVDDDHHREAYLSKEGELDTCVRR